MDDVLRLKTLARHARPSLDRIAEEERDVEWLKASIITNFALLNNEMQTWDQLRQLKTFISNEELSQFRCPLNFAANPEPITSCAYGAGWRGPDKVYSYPWDKTERVFRSYNVEYERQLTLNMVIYVPRDLGAKTEPCQAGAIIQKAMKAALWPDKMIEVGRV